MKYTNKYAVLADLQETREMLRIYLRQNAKQSEIDALRTEVTRLKKIHNSFCNS